MQRVPSANVSLIPYPAAILTKGFDFRFTVGRSACSAFSVFRAIRARSALLRSPVAIDSSALRMVTNCEA
jgi:hypothetical protein